MLEEHPFFVNVRDRSQASSSEASQPQSQAPSNKKERTEVSNGDSVKPKSETAAFMESYKELEGYYRSLLDPDEYDEHMIDKAMAETFDSEEPDFSELLELEKLLTGQHGDVQEDDDFNESDKEEFRPASLFATSSSRTTSGVDGSSNSRSGSAAIMAVLNAHHRSDMDEDDSLPVVDISESYEDGLSATSIFATLSSRKKSGVDGSSNSRSGSAAIMAVLNAHCRSDIDEDDNLPVVDISESYEDGLSATSIFATPSSMTTSGKDGRSNSGLRLPSIAEILAAHQYSDFDEDNTLPAINRSGSYNEPPATPLPNTWRPYFQAQTTHHRSNPCHNFIAAMAVWAQDSGVSQAHYSALRNILEPHHHLPASVDTLRHLQHWAISEPDFGV